VPWGEPHAVSLWENIEPGSHAVAPALAALNASDHAVAVTTSQAPLRMLITRRTARHRLIDVQYLLSSMGFLAPQKFDGTFGKATVAAIKAFQQAHDLPVNAALTDDLISAVYKVAGKEEPPQWHLFVRQNFSSLFDVPVTIRDPERPLGTHIFTAMRFVPGDARVQWTEIDLEGGDGARVLDRVDIPSDARRRIAARLTPGSALIIGDTSVDSAILPEGDDFLVWTKETPAASTSRTARADEAEAVHTPKTPKIKTSRPAPAIAKPRPKRENRVGRKRHGAPRGYSYRPPRFGRSGLFSSW
jgi:peptidoglycan hydrolase-like protein with peptidoglycan-binding domain